MDPHRLFSALADPTRLEVLTRLAGEGPATATQLSTSLPVSRQAVSKHLNALHTAGLVRRETAGREVRYTFDPGPLAEVVRWTEEVGGTWDRRLQRLRRVIG